MNARKQTRFKQTEIGPIPEEWEVKELGEEIELLYGKGLPEQKRNYGEIPVFGSNGIVGFHDKPLVKGPGIIIGRKGSVGEVKYSKKDFWCIDTTYYVRLKFEGSYEFWYYFLKNLGLEKLNSHSAVPGLNREQVHDIVSPLPPLSEQKAIAKVLSDLDDRIELNQRMNKTLEEIAQAIFKRWFIDFEFPNENGKPYKSSGGKMVYSPELNKQIPEGWRVGKFDDLVEAKQGLYLEENEISETKNDFKKYPVWGGNGIRGYIDKFMYCDPVVIITCRGSNCGLINITDSKCWISNIAFACIPKVGSSYFIYIFFKNCNFDDCISGSAQPQITYSNLKNKIMPIPINEKIVNLYSKFMENIFSKTSMNNKLSHTLTQLRDLLLPRLMSGKLRIADVERFLKERGL